MPPFVLPLLARIIPKLLIVVAVACTALLLVKHGEDKAEQRHIVEELQTFEKTVEKINEVRPSTTRRAAVDRLRTHGWVREGDM